MKKLYTLSAILITFLSFAQVPQGISYQAIALDASGNPVVSANVGIRLSILDATATGAVLYSESHIKMTNPQGLFNLVIGQGTSLSGTFTSIKWETNSKFLKVEMDAAGGTNYVLVGTTELLSVPYALMAGKVKSEDVVGDADQVGFHGSWYSSSFMTSTNAYIFSPALSLYNSDLPPTANSWYSTSISGVPFMKSQNSFLTTTNAYIFSASNNAPYPYDWYSFPISGQPVKIKTDQNFTLIITSTNAYAYFGFGASNLYPTTINGTLIDSDTYDGALGILTSSNAYIFTLDSTGTSGSWHTIPITGTPLKIKHIRGGVLALTSTNAYLYGTDYTSLNGSSSTMSWHNIPISGTLLLD